MAVHSGAVLEDSAEHRAMRGAVGGIVAKFGPDYYQQQVDDGGHCAELWKTLGANGYLGVHLPEKYGGGGLGLSELAIVVHEAAVAGCPMQSMLFSSGVTGTILDRSANEEQKHAGYPASPAATRGCRSQSPSRTRAPTRTESRRPPGAKVTDTS